MRMSTDDQATSIELQAMAIQEYAEKNGIEIVATYADEGRSGVSISGRSEMQQLLRDVMDEGCPFTKVLVLDVSRWGRFQDVDEAAYYEFHCRKNGVRVEYVAEPFKSSAVDGSPFDSMLKQMKRAMAGEYSRELGVKVRAGLVKLVSQGYAAGCLPCIGYRRMSIAAGNTGGVLLAPYERKRSHTDHVRWVLASQDEVAIVQKVFKDYASGTPVTRIVAELKASGAKTHDDAEFTLTKIKRLLKNPVVTGRYSWGGRKRSRTNLPALPTPVTNMMVPAIVDMETWDLVQRRISQAKHFRILGLPDDALIQKLRDAVQLRPELRSSDFLQLGLPSPTTYRNHFGSIGRALSLAGRQSERFDAALSKRRTQSQEIRQRLIKDVYRLACSIGLPARLDAIRAVVAVGAQEIRLRVARPMPFVIAPRWHTQHAKHVRDQGRWLLLMRMNDDGCTGKDFYLLPPDIHRTFTGLLSSATMPAYEPFRISDHNALIRALYGVASQA